MIQLYGHFSNYFSFGNVSRGYAWALSAHDIPFQLWDVSDFRSTGYLDARGPVGVQSDAPVGIAVGYPTTVINWLREHPVKVLVTVCETDRIPKSWVGACNSCDLVVVPSGFCQEAFEASGVTAEVVVAKHGVFPELFAGLPSSSFVRRSSLLHVSGSLSFPARKGTVPLMRALAKVDPTRPLTVVSPSKKLHDIADELGLVNFTTFDFPQGLPPARWGRFLAGYSAVVQPSRAEGFGLVPLEARCVGVPVILSRSTGHYAHIAPSDRLVNTRGWALMDTQGNKMGSAPFVDQESLEKQLASFFADEDSIRERTRDWANDSAGYWLYTRQLDPLMKRLKATIDKRGRRLRDLSPIGG